MALLVRDYKYQPRFGHRVAFGSFAKRPVVCVGNRPPMRRAKRCVYRKRSSARLLHKLSNRNNFLCLGLVPDQVRSDKFKCGGE